MCCLILSHLFFYLLSVSFLTLIAYLTPAGDRNSALCSDRKIGSLFLIVVVGTAVIKRILKNNVMVIIKKFLKILQLMYIWN